MLFSLTRFLIFDCWDMSPCLRPLCRERLLGVEDRPGSLSLPTAKQSTFPLAEPSR